MGNFAPGTTAGLLTGIGLDLLSRPPSGNILQTASLAAKGPLKIIKQLSLDKVKRWVKEYFLSR